jgi:ethanolamine ammonia-lyase small subunit
MKNAQTSFSSMGGEEEENPVEKKPLVIVDPWSQLRQVTGARIALGRAGGSLPTAPLLDFQLAHARARDAVHLEFDVSGVRKQLRECGYAELLVRSEAANRSVYLQRPDLGRRLDDRSRAALTDYARASGDRFDAAFVIADGLSPLAVHRHAVAVLHLASNALTTAGWRLAPVVIAGQSRVALGDEIGHLLGAEQVAILIGERPGLSAADSLGIYLTYAPRPGRTDAERNCISNIRPEGLGYEEAAQKLVRLMTRARRYRLTGVELKDDSDMLTLPPSEG